MSVAALERKSAFDEDKSEAGRSDANRQQTLFPDAKAMKDHLREQMLKPEYDVASFYHTTGFCQWLARQSLFEKTTLSVIVANAAWIAVDTDHNNADVLVNAHPIFQIAEHVFCMFFLFEWTVRFCAFKSKCDCRKDTWFVFDSVLVSTMVVETWLMTAVLLVLGNGSGGLLGNASILRVARLLRLSRMARMARLLRAMPELLILLKGLKAATRSVLFTLTLLIIIIYVFGIAFTQLCGDTTCGDDFGGVIASMHILLVQGALMNDMMDVVDQLQSANVGLLLMFYMFLLLSALTIMNMLIGVICEVVSAVAATEREQMNLAEVRDKIRELMLVGDANSDNVISKAEFMVLLANKTAAAILTGVGVDVFDLVDFADYIFADDARNLSFADLMNLVLDLRGSNTATVKDIVDLRRFVKQRFSEIEQALVEQPRSCNSTISRPRSSRLHHSKDHLPASPKSSCFEFAPKHDKFMSMPPLEAEDSSGNFKHLVESSLNLLLSAHESAIAAMKAENSCLQESLCNSQMITISRQISEDEILIAELAKSCAHGTKIPTCSAKSSIVTSGHISGSARSREGQASYSSHSCLGGREASDPVTHWPAAARPAWDPPNAPAESDSRSTAGPTWLSSARVVPITAEREQVASIED